jgi:hypothetical protein
VLKARTELPELCASLVNVIQFESVKEESVKAAADLGITLRSFADLLAVVRDPFTPSPLELPQTCVVVGVMRGWY